MADDILSLRAIVVTRTEGLAGLFREASSVSSVPIEIIEIVDCASGSAAFGSADLVYIDGALPPPDIAQVMSVLRALKTPPFSILLATVGAAAVPTDGLAGKPSRVQESEWLLDHTIRARLPSRVLVVDDSATMRMIVRKALAATRFPFRVSEADNGAAAIELAASGDFDIVFLDYNMPGLSGFEALAELNRNEHDISVVMITSTEDEELVKRARKMGAAFLKKPFFPADIETALCSHYGLRAIYPRQV